MVGSAGHSAAERESQVPWDRSDIVAASFAAAGPRAAFDPVRAQKLLFLIDREVSERIGGPYFDFRPHRSGPFDPALYRVLDDLARVKDVRFDDSGRCRRYLLSDKGHGRGAAVLDRLPEPIGKYLRDAARWVRLTPYRRMLAAIYRQYPDTAVDGVADRLRAPRRKGVRSPFLRGVVRALDFTGTSHRQRDSGRVASSDADAIRDAWRAVGEELEEAMSRFGDSERLW